MCSRAPTSAVAISHSMKSAPRSAGRSNCWVKTGWPAARRVLSAASAGSCLALADLHEEAVGAVRLDLAERLARDRQHARAGLAGRLGDQLLEPEADRGQIGGQHEGQLVAAPGVGVRDHLRERPGGIHAEVVVALGERGRGAPDHGADVDPGEHGGHEPERRQRRVAPAHVGAAVRDVRPALAARARLERRAGVGDRDEAAAVAAGRAPERIGEAVGLERRARLRGDHEQRALDRHRADRVGVGRVEHVQALAAVQLADHERGEARAAHAAEHDALVARSQRPGPGLELREALLRLLDRADPPEPGVLARIGPERGVAREQARDLCRRAHARAGASSCAFSAIVVISESNDLRERLHALVDELVQQDAIEIDPEALELGHVLGSGVHLDVDRARRVSAGARGVDRRLGHRVDRVRADQRVHVERVGIRRVLRRRRGPERALDVGALGGERLPARAGEDALERAVGELRVGDRGDPLQLGVAELLEALVDLAVDARDEEARDRGDAVDRLAGRRALLEALDVRVRDLLVALDREQERHVDGDPRGRELAERLDALGRRGHLDQHVRAVDLLEDALGLLHRPLGVARELGQQLERDVAVLALGLLEDRAQQVGTLADVGVGELEEDRARVEAVVRPPPRARGRRARSRRWPSRRSWGWRSRR